MQSTLIMTMGLPAGGQLIIQHAALMLPIYEQSLAKSNLQYGKYPQEHVGYKIIKLQEEIVRCSTDLASRKPDIFKKTWNATAINNIYDSAAACAKALHAKQLLDYETHVSECIVANTLLSLKTPRNN